MCQRQSPSPEASRVASDSRTQSLARSTTLDWVAQHRGRPCSPVLCMAISPRIRADAPPGATRPR
jgi:hypothetical protein